jgi:electron transfer flavoprotein beta subunit
MSTLIKGSPHITSTHPPTGETDQVPAEGGSPALAAAAVDMLFTTYPKLAGDLAG